MDPRSVRVEMLEPGMEAWARLAEQTTVSWCSWMCNTLRRFSHVWLCVTLWTVAHQAPLSMDSPGKNTGVGCHALLQGNLPTPEIKPTSIAAPALQAESWLPSHQVIPRTYCCFTFFLYKGKLSSMCTFPCVLNNRNTNNKTCNALLKKPRVTPTTEISNLKPIATKNLRVSQETQLLCRICLSSGVMPVAVLMLFRA